MSLPLFPAAVLTLVSALCCAAMARFGAIDHPGPRSSHQRPTPKGGGVGIVLASLLGMIWLGGASDPIMALAGGGLLLAVVGYLDDRHSFPPITKLGAQLIAALLVPALGIMPPFSHSFWLNGLVSFGWVMLVINAVNFMDGLNGLAAGVALLVALLCPAGGITLGMAAGIIGFLPFNYPRARLFMGDVGSQYCGYWLAVMALTRANQPGAWVVPLMLAGLLCDVLFTLARRFRAGEKLWHGHRGHLYQIAQRSGVSAWLVSAIHWLFALAGWAAAALGWLGVVPVLVVQALWLSYVIRRTHLHPVGRW